MVNPPHELFVQWDKITTADVETLQRCLEGAERERDLQRYLENCPLMLIQHLGGGNGRWVIPQKRLGAEYVPDFLIGNGHSAGFDWTAVELEGPKARLFNKNGDPSATLNHAIRQITDWRAWLKKNQNYAARGRDENGLGLTDIDSDVTGLVLIGRDSGLKPADRGRWRELSTRLRIEIHTYDWLIYNAWCSQLFSAIVTSMGQPVLKEQKYGLFYLNKLTDKGLRKSIDYFNQAIENDADYAPAYAGLAASYVWLGHWGSLPISEAG